METGEAVPRIFRPDDSDDHARGSPADLGVEPKFPNPRDDALDLVFGRVRLSYNNHDAFSRNPIMSPGNAKCKPRAGFPAAPS
jgi:hypothetical protein